MLKLHGRGQHNVGIFSSVSQKMFYHDREEIRALQAPSNLGLLRHARERIAAVDKKSFDRRVVQLEQPFPQPRHTYRFRVAPSQVLPAQRPPVSPPQTPPPLTHASP